MARAMFKRAPTAQELATVGMTPEDYTEDDEEVVEVWPENLPVYDLWQIVGDQWRSGPNGPFALDLIPVFHELDRMGLEKPEYDSLLSGVKVVAGVRLDEIHKE